MRQKRKIGQTRTDHLSKVRRDKQRLQAQASALPAHRERELPFALALAAHLESPAGRKGQRYTGPHSAQRNAPGALYAGGSIVNHLPRAKGGRQASKRSGA